MASAHYLSATFQPYGRRRPPTSSGKPFERHGSDGALKGQLSSTLPAIGASREHNAPRPLSSSGNRREGASGAGSAGGASGLKATALAEGAWGKVRTELRGTPTKGVIDAEMLLARAFKPSAEAFPAPPLPASRGGVVPGLGDSVNL
eukprot:CAMPEP_0185547464 /NCGR_PEP_ID=MMETSP1381-20130426/6138_1 /TAXON_ID=298111 /ORGANISM="Pavlova sp., Strain CCMP459" /LENGTH=146 /DNA_ID=CAMNT_0028160013 /DNA_START=14 /DNA_END=451 /DNA_ORIENTATION=-